MRTLTALLLLVPLAAIPGLEGAEHKAVFPPGVKPVGPYSPGVVAGGLLYVSGQGARDASSNLPEGIEAQVRQTLENVKAVLDTQKLSMQHVVSTQVYLADIKNAEILDRVWAKYFAKDAPARTVIGVARMPTDTPVEVSAVAVLDLRKKKVIRVPGVKLTEPVSAAIDIGDRVFLTGGLGREVTGKVPNDTAGQVKIAIDGAEKILLQAGLDLRHMVYANIYVDPAMQISELAKVVDEALPDETAKTIIQTTALPMGAHFQIGGIASRELKRIGGHCSTVADTIYCSGRVGTIRQALESLKADLAVSRTELSQTVASNVYIDELDEFAAMNKVYATFFGAVAPTRTTVQPWKRVGELSLRPTTGVSPKKDDSPRVQISIIAVR